MMPFIPIVLALRREVAAALAGHEIRGEAITARHFRHREARSDECPSVGIRIMSPADVSASSEQTTSTGLPEQLMELSINLVVDLELEPEADEVDDETGDPTGFGDHAQVVAWILDRLLPDLEAGAEPNTLGGLVWSIQYDGTAPSEDGVDASPDRARMEERLTILYRVRADHPTTLLTES